MHHRKGADHRHRHRQQRDDGGTPGLQKDDDHQHHQRHGFEQRVHHGFNRRAHKLRGVVDDFIVHAFGHGLFQVAHHGLHVVRDLDRVGARRGKHRHSHGLFVVQQRAQGVVGRAQFQAGDVTQAGHGTTGVGFDDDVAELFFTLQTALRVDGQLHINARQTWRRAHHPGRSLDVLFTNRPHHVPGGQTALSDFLRVQPDTHRIIARAEQLHLAHATNARQPVLDVEHRVVAQVGHVVAVIGRGQMHHHRQVR